MADSSKPRGLGRTIYRHLWKPILLFTFYALIIYALPRLISTEALKDIFTEQAQYIIGTDVEIGKVEFELKLLGGWRLRLRKIKILNPSPDFGLEGDSPLLAINKVVFEGSVVDLLHSLWQPRILVKGWTLHAYRSSRSGVLNLATLFQKQGPPPPSWEISPLSKLVSADQNFELEDGIIKMSEGTMGSRDWTTVTVLPRGKAHYTPSNSETGTTSAINFIVSGQGFESEKDSSIELNYRIDNFLFAVSGLRGAWRLNLNGNNLPLNKLTTIFRIPGTPDGAVLRKGSALLTGNFGIDHHAVLESCQIELSGCPVPELGCRGPLSITLKTLPPDEDKAASIDHSQSDILINFKSQETGAEGSARLHAGKDGFSKLTMNTSILDLSKISPDGKWSKQLIPSLEDAEVVASKLSLYGLLATNARLTAKLDQTRVVSSTLSGNLCGGSVECRASGAELSSTELPKGFILAVDKAEAKLLAAMLAPLLRPEMRLIPSSGKLSLAVISPPENTRLSEKHLSGFKNFKFLKQLLSYRSGIEGWTMLVKIEEPILFLEPGGNPLLKALWHFPSDLSSLEEATSKQNLPTLTSLQLNTGLLAMEEDGSLIGELASRELGAISLEHKAGAEGLFTMSLYPYRSKAETHMPELSQPLKRAVSKVERRKGLEISVASDKNGIKIEKNFVKDISNFLPKTNIQ